VPFVLRAVWAAAIVPILLMAVAAAASFAVALLLAWRVLALLAAHPGDAGLLIVQLVRVVDATLLGVVMVVIAFGLYELLIERVPRPLPAALRVRSLQELEGRVLRTVVMIMAVTALEAVVEPAPHVEQLEVVAGAAVAILALTLFLRFEERAREREP
jgi:uncharacterized membrane protein YqhA